MLYERHGHKSQTYESPTYSCWKSAKQRCINPKSSQFPYYGGRGISMCNEWSNSFAAFLAHMGERPDNTSIDRIDNQKGYEPGNCRWATPEQQARNKRNNRTDWDEYRILRDRYLSGIPMKVMAKERGVCRQSIRKCIKRYEAWLDFNERELKTSDPSSLQNQKRTPY